jgi:hypothetical protein
MLGMSRQPKKEMDKWHGYGIGIHWDITHTGCIDKNGLLTTTIIDNGRRMGRTDCERECRKKQAAACEFLDDNYDRKGACYYFATERGPVHDCRYGDLSKVSDNASDACEEYFDGAEISCMVFSNPTMNWRKTSDEYSVYVGCFKDNTKDRAMSLYIGKGKNLNTCARICKNQGYMYFGRQHHNHCFCGNEYDKHGKSYLCNCDHRTNVGGGVNCVYKTK